VNGAPARRAGLATRHVVAVRLFTPESERGASPAR